MALNRIAITFIFLHTTTFFSVVTSIILSFKNPLSLRNPLFTSSILHLFVAYINLKNSNAPNQSFLNKVFLNYSVHIIGANILFFFGFPSFSWLVVLGLSSLYQILVFLVYQVLPSHKNNWLLNKCHFLYTKLTNPPIAEMILCMMEIMSMMPSISPKGINNNSIIVSIVYLFWYVLYRYATDNNHKQIWAQLRQQIATLAYKLPSFLCRIIMAILHPFENLGTLGCQIYRVSS